MRTKKQAFLILILIAFTNILAINKPDNTLTMLMDTFSDDTPTLSDDEQKTDAGQSEATNFDQKSIMLNTDNKSDTPQVTTPPITTPQVTIPQATTKTNVGVQKNLSSQNNSTKSTSNNLKSKVKKVLNKDPIKSEQTKTTSQNQPIDENQVEFIAEKVVPILVHNKGYENLSKEQVTNSINDFMQENHMEKASEEFLSKVRSKVRKNIEHEIMDLNTSFLRQQKMLRNGLNELDSIQDKAQFIIDSITIISEKHCEDATYRLFCVVPIKEKLSKEIADKAFIRKQTSVLERFKKLSAEQLKPLEDQLEEHLEIQKPLSVKKYSELKDKLEASVTKARTSYDEMVKMQDDQRQKARDKLRRLELMYGKMIEMGKARNIMKKSNLVNIENHEKMKETRNSELKDKFRVLKNEFSEIKGLLQGKMDNFRKVDIAAKKLFDDQISNILGNEWVDEKPLEEESLATKIDERQQNVLGKYGSNIEKYRQNKLKKEIENSTQLQGNQIDMKSLENAYSNSKLDQSESNLTMPSSLEKDTEDKAEDFNTQM